MAVWWYLDQANTLWLITDYNIYFLEFSFADV